MEDWTSKIAKVDHRLRASERREWQLWLVTLALLVVFALGSVLAVSYILLQTSWGDSPFPEIAFRLLVGLALLVGLFCLYVLQTRLSVSRFKLFLNEMSGMATGNLDYDSCLEAIVEGMARTCRASFCRFLIQRPVDAALEIGASFCFHDIVLEPPKGYSHALGNLTLLSAAAESEHPSVIGAAGLGSLPESGLERRLLTGGLPRVDSILVLPVRGSGSTLGLLVLARQKSWRQRRYHPRETLYSTVLASHAGRVVEQANRRREAVCDPLTGLFNRRHFHERIGQEIKRASRRDESLAFLLCDLDRLKQVNDGLGHQVGDEVLRRAATAVKSATRGTDLHFRWGGDEFVVVLSGTTGSGYLTAAERIRDQIHRSTSDLNVDIDTSVGVALYPDHGSDPEELVQVADLAMYVAKKSGEKVRVGYQTYEIDEDCVKFVYQPIRDVSTGEIHGHEVLARDPGGSLSPLELFEKYRAVGQLEAMEQLVFERQLLQAVDAGLQRLFVNARMRFLLKTEPIPAPSELEVVIEIAGFTGGLWEQEWIATLLRWRQAGYRLALAGFGADHSFLSVIEPMRPDYLKVARSIIVRAARSERHRSFLEHLLRAARSLESLKIIGEGIETPSELEVVRDLGIGLGQGFLLGRPDERTCSGPQSDSGFPAPASGHQTSDASVIR